jgi:hypothetical protein
LSSAGFAEKQLNALRKKGAKSGGNEGWANEGGEEEFYDSENVFEAKQVAAKGPSIDDCGSEKQFWSTLERMEQTEERKQGQKRKFGKFGHLVHPPPSRSVVIYYDASHSSAVGPAAELLLSSERSHGQASQDRRRPRHRLLQGQCPGSTFPPRKHCLNRVGWCASDSHTPPSLHAS